jgi:tRNA threonylcarbamoyladenosine biosynthesis protein TsaB
MADARRRPPPPRARPIALACDTSTTAGTVALVEGDRVTAELALQTPGSTSRRLLADMRDLLAARGLQPSDLDLLVTSVGPGSFTGVRITLAAMKGLAFALGKPLHAVPSLVALARPAFGRGEAVLAALDARRAEIYAAAWGPDGAVLLAPCAADPRAAASALRDALPAGVRVRGVGEGVLAYREALAAVLGDRLVVGDAPEHGIRASVLVQAALESGEGPVDVAAVEPMYLRRSEAEVKRDGP